MATPTDRPPRSGGLASIEVVDEEKAAASTSTPSSQPSSRPTSSLPSPTSRSTYTPSPADIFVLDQTDVDYVSSRLDHFAALYKADVQHRLQSLLQRHESDKQTIGAQAAAIEQLQHNIDGLVEQVHTATVTSTTITSHHSALRQRLLAHLSTSHSHHTLTRCLLAWRHHAHHSARTSRSSLHLRRRLLQRSLFTRWRTWTRAEKDARIDAYWREQLKRVREEVGREREAEVNQLKDDLKDLHVTLRMYDRDKGEREERLKQAFVRGVCALNREAMEAFEVGAMGGDVGGGGGGGGGAREEKESGGQGEWRAGEGGWSGMSGSTVSSIPLPSASSSGSDGGMGESGVGGMRGGGVVSFQPIPMRLSHPYPPVQVPVVTRTVSAGAREDWAAGRGVGVGRTGGSTKPASGGGSSVRASFAGGSSSSARAHSVKR